MSEIKYVEPCPLGCFFEDTDGKLHLIGDCRIPWSENCYMNKKKTSENLVRTKLEDEDGDETASSRAE